MELGIASGGKNFNFFSGLLIILQIKWMSLVSVASISMIKSPSFLHEE